MSDFKGPRSKIERAKQHISDLHARISDFQASDFYGFVADKHPKTGDDIFHFKETKALPKEDLALITGDALHNLKGALDIAVNEVIFSRLGRYDDFARFPFRKTRDELVTAIKGGLIYQASKAVADLIVDSVKPYKGGNDALWSLHELNILDKHRLLLPVLRVSALHNPCFEDDRGQKLSVGLWVFSGPRLSLTPFPGHKNLKITDKGKPTV